MKVVWVNRSEWRKPGPIVYIGLLNARAFALRGDEVAFYCSEGAPSDTNDDLESFYGIDAPAGLTIHRVPRGGRWSELRGRRVYLQALSRARQWLEAGEEVLFLTRELGATPGLARLQRRFGDRLRTVYEAHDFHADLSRRSEVDFNDRRKRFTERFALPRLSGIVAITSDQAALYREALPSTRVLGSPLGCLDFSRTAATAESLYARRSLAYIGHLHRQKGVPQLLEHEARLAERGIRLEIIGGDESRVTQLRRKLKLGERSSIAILPGMPPSRLHEHLAAHIGAGLVPLEDNFYNRHLTCPVKALDSMAHHFPVLASDLPSTREVIGPAGCFVPPGDGDALAEAIFRLFEDRQRFLDLSAAAASRARELDWKTRAERIVDWAWERS